MKITSIDVGLVHMGLVSAEVKDTACVVTYCNLIDLTCLPHARVSRSVCRLHHTADAADRVQHFIQEFGHDHMDKCDVLLIERQPLGGLVHVEQLLYQHYRDKAHLCSPNAMHKHFSLAKCDYDKRKQQTIQIAEPYLCATEAWHAHWDRRHDMADALCVILYWRDKHVRPLPLLLQGTVCITEPVLNFLEQFRFNPLPQN